MIKLGAQAEHAGKMEQIHKTMIRLRLHLIMSLAYLDGCPVGIYRKKAVINNLERLKKEIDVFGIKKGLGLSFNDNSSDESVFLQRIQLLFMMSKAFSEDLPIGHYRKEAMRNNVYKIGEQLGFRVELEPAMYLKAA